jgi:hypothetical protein
MFFDISADSGMASGVTHNQVFRRGMKYNLLSTSKAAVIYIIIFMAILFAAKIILTIHGTDENGLSDIFDDADILTIISNSNSFSLFVFGICVPLWLRTYMLFGMTRGQFAIATLATGAILSCGFAVITAVISAAMGKFSMPYVFMFILVMMTFWLMGWLAIIGFQFYHFLTAAAGITLCVILFGLIFNYTNIRMVFSVWGNNEEYIISPPYENGILILIAIIVALATSMVFLTKRIPVRSH